MQWVESDGSVHPGNAFLRAPTKHEEVAHLRDRIGVVGVQFKGTGNVVLGCVELAQVKAYQAEDAMRPRLLGRKADTARGETEGRTQLSVPAETVPADDDGREREIGVHQAVRWIARESFREDIVSLLIVAL